MDPSGEGRVRKAPNQKGRALSNLSRQLRALPGREEIPAAGSRALRTLLEELHSGVEGVEAEHAALVNELDGARELFRLVPDACLVTDVNGVIGEANQAAARLFGIEARFLRGKPLSMFVAPEERVPFRRRMKRMRAGEIVTPWLVQLVTRHRSAFPTRITVTSDRRSLDSPTVFRWVIRDVTEPTVVGAEQDHNRFIELGAMVTRIAHDVGNPLAGITMHARLIADSMTGWKAPESARVRGAAEEVVSQVRRLDQLVSGLKELARVPQIDLHPIDLARFLGAVARFWRPAARTHGITIESEVPRNEETVLADESQLWRVFHNLVKNSIEAIAHGPGIIHLMVADPRPQKVAILVSDSGPGVARDVDPFAIFETTKPGGTGLGLTIAREIAEAHGGSLEHVPRRHGTVFRLELPRLPSESMKPRASTSDLGLGREPRLRASGLSSLGSEPRVRRRKRARKR